MQTPFGDLPREVRRLSMAEIDEALRRPRRVSRRALVQGMAAGAVGPLLWARPGWSAVAPGGLHLAYGADARTAVAVSWSTPGPVEAPALDLGTTTAYGRTLPAETRTVRGTATCYHHVRLDGLRPGTTHHYRLRHRGATGTDRTFRTAPDDPRAPFRFTAFGDQGVSAQAVAGLSRLVAARPAFHVHAGDLCYANRSGSGGPQQPLTPNVWDAWLRQNARAAQRGVMWMPTVGNHEMEPGQGPQGYDGFLARFALPRNGVPGARNTWSFRYGDVAVVGLDGNDASYELPYDRGWLGARQDLWLRQTLSRLRADPAVDFVVAAFHNCVYCTGSRHGSDGGMRDRFRPVLEEFGVDLVVNGHNHSYERTHPLRRGAVTRPAPRGAVVRPATDGTTYVVAGGGGADGGASLLHPYGYVWQPDRTKERERAPWSAVRSRDHNLLVADVTPRTGDGTARMRLRAVRPDGALLDEVTLERPARA